MSLEDMKKVTFYEEKEVIEIASRSKVRELCKEFGIKNEKMVGNYFSTIIKYLKQKRYDIVDKIIKECRESRITTKL